MNLGSLLTTKMVKEGFGIDGKDLDIGADILVRLVTTDPIDSKQTSGDFFDDAGDFGSPHSAVINYALGRRLITSLDSIIHQTDSK